MIDQLTLILPTAFGFAAVVYLWLAVRVSRASTQSANSAISYFLFLIAAMVGGQQPIPGTYGTFKPIISSLPGKLFDTPAGDGG